MQRHVLLVGLPGVGKSTVGQLVAEGAAGAAARHRQDPGPADGDAGRADLRHGGRAPVPGHGARRRRHRPGPGAGVIVPGAGWAAQPGQMEAAKPSCLIIYLKCSVATAARRSEQGEVRPLLVGADPVERVRTLLAAREPFYKLADYEVAADAKARRRWRTSGPAGEDPRRVVGDGRAVGGSRRTAGARSD